MDTETTPTVDDDAPALAGAIVEHAGAVCETVDHLYEPSCGLRRDSDRSQTFRDVYLPRGATCRLSDSGSLLQSPTAESDLAPQTTSRSMQYVR